MISAKIARGLLLVGIYVLGILGIAASGGGGGGSDGATSISYVGNTDAAQIDRGNAAKLVSNIFIGNTIVDASSGLATRVEISVDSSPDNIDLARFPGRLSQRLRNAINPSISLVSGKMTFQARTDVNETQACDSGSVEITGYIEDDLSGLLDLDFRNCREGNETLNGEVTAQVNNFDIFLLVPIDAVYRFKTLTVSTPDFSVSISGSIHTQLFTGMNGQGETLTIDKLVSRNNANGEMLMITNQIIQLDYDNILFPTTLLETLEGRIYDSVHGYVDFVTIQALNFISVTRLYPDAGQLLLTGDANAGVQVRVISDSHTLLELDLDGDLSFEIQATLSWSELETAPDLADSDSDFIHDSWELENGLDPNDASDAGMDRDFDGFTNLEEYLAGTDLDDAGDAPPSADLSISKTGSGVPLVSSNYSYVVHTTNLGPNAATNVQVTDNLPTGTAFVQAFGSGWNCSNSSATVLCSRNSLPLNASPSITITVTLPANPGTIFNTAEISSVTLDPNPGNNSATIQTNVLPPNADLSVSILSNPTGIVTGDSFIYVIRVDNNGPSTATDVALTDVLPANISFDSAVPTQGSCNGTTTISCDFGNIDPSSFAAVNLFVTGAAEGIADNTVNVTSSSLDLDIGNNTASTTTAVGTSTSVIQNAINAAVNGDTITVPPGVYIGHIDFIGKEITIISDQGPMVTIIDGAQTNQAVVSLVNGEGPATLFSGFTVQNGGNGGIRVSNSSPAIINNIVENNLKPGSGVGIELNFSSATVSGNIIRGNNRGPGSGGGGGGISVGGASNALILNNHVIDNLWGGGIELFAAGIPVLNGNLISGNIGDGLASFGPMEGDIIQNVIVGNTGVGIREFGDGNGLFLNNTVAGNQGSAIYALGFPAGTELINNIIVSDDTAIECDPIGGSVIDPTLFRFNNVYSATTTPYTDCIDQTGINGNISTAPAFIDPSIEDFRLGPTSPLIDMGDNTIPDLPSTDFLGNSRIIDGDQNGSIIVDMGAYEYIP